jgi:ABC-2 type transport system permease protein
MERLRSGEKPRIKVYFAADTPEEVQDAVEVLLRELAYLQSGQPLAIEVSEEILGPDMTGRQIPPRDRLRPLFTVILLLTETLGLAALISEEVERRTIHALLVTPATIKDLFAAKGVTGVSLALIPAALFLTIAGGISDQPLTVLVTLVLGAVLVTGVGFLIASLAKDLMSVMAWGVVIIIVLFLPSVGIVFPGTITGWVEVIPSYYLVDTVHRVANFGSGWAEVWRNLLVLLGFDLGIVWLGIMALGRKIR